MSKNPPPYSDSPPGWTPAQTYQPPPPGPQPSHTVVVTNVAATPVHQAVGPNSTRVICPSCRAEVLTTMKHEPTTKTHLMALCLFCFIEDPTCERPSICALRCTAISVQVGPHPVRMVCPYCRANIVTSVRAAPTFKTHLMALCLCCFICWPCVCLPYCMDSCQNANHYCPNCNAFIGTYQS